MRLLRKGIFAAGLLMAAFGIAIPSVRAQQESQPVAIVSIAPLDRLLQDTSYLLRAANVPEIGGLVNIMANQYTQGLDRSRPLGASVTLEGQFPSALIFLPIKDRSQFFGALAGMGIEPDDLGDGLFEIDAGGQTVYAKDTGAWLFIAQTENSLANLSVDPSVALGELPQKYDVAVRVNVQALPAEMREMATEQMRIGFERGLAEQRGQTAEERESAKQIGEAQIAQLEQLITDTEQIFIGWNADVPGQKVYVDFGAQFLEGSKLAKQTEALRDLTTGYANFAMPDAAARFRFSSRVTDEDKLVQKQNLRSSIGQLEQQLEKAEGMPAEAKSMLKDLINGLVTVTEQTIDEGIFDGAGSLSLADDSLRVLIGGRLADGAALEREIVKAMSKLPSSQQAPKFESNYATYKGFRLHRVSVPVDISDPDAKRVFGDELKLTIGISEKSFMISLDPAGDAALKAAIDRMETASEQKVGPFDGVVQFEQMLRFAQAVSPNSMTDLALQKIRQFSGKDKVVIAGNLIPRGGIYRIAVDEGVLQAAGAAAKGGGRGNGGF